MRRVKHYADGILDRLLTNGTAIADECVTVREKELRPCLSGRCQVCTRTCKRCAGGTGAFCTAWACGGCEHNCS